jgi:alkylation response protein AidB-like acyl-CoA dehydrogenase
MDFIISEEAGAAAEAVARIAAERNEQLAARSPWRGEAPRQDDAAWARLSASELVGADATRAYLAGEVDIDYLPAVARAVGEGLLVLPVTEQVVADAVSDAIGRPAWPCRLVEPSDTATVPFGPVVDRALVAMGARGPVTVSVSGDGSPVGSGPVPLAAAIVVDRLVVDDAHVGDVERSFALGSILRLATAAGVARAAVAVAVAYSQERHQFGRPIAAFQAVQHRLADMHIDARFVDGALYCALEAWVADDLAAVAEHVATGLDVAVATGRGACQVLGGYGFTMEYAAQHALRYLRQLRSLGTDVVLAATAPPLAAVASGSRYA